MSPKFSLGKILWGRGKMDFFGFAANGHLVNEFGDPPS